MSALVDPSLCPDCRSPLGPDARCPGCGLHLAGPRSGELWQALVRADGILEGMRRDQAAREDVAPADAGVRADSAADREPAYAGAVPTGHAASVDARLGGTAGAPPLAPGAAMPGPMPPRPAVTGRAVPVILFGIGGLFVLVAASVFLAAAWEVLPLEIKALIMLGVTTLFGAGAWWAARRGLRGTSETLWTIAALLVLLDVNAARAGDLFGLGAVDGQHVTAFGGALVAGASTWFALLSKRLRTGACLAAELAVGLGVGLVLLSEVWSGPLSGAVVQTIAVPLVAAAGVALLPRLRIAAYVVLTLTGLTWLVLLGTGLDAAAGAASRADYWTGVLGWPVLATALLAGAVTLVSRLPDLVRQLAAVVALIVGAWFVMLPPSWDTTQVLLGAGVGLAVAALGLTRVPQWSSAAACVSAFTALVAGGLVLLLPFTAAAWAYRYSGPWAGSGGDTVRLLTAPAGWTLPVLALVTVAAVLAAARPVPALRGVARPMAPGVLALGVAGWLADLGLALVVITFVLALAAIALVAPLARHRTVPMRVATLGSGSTVLALALLLAARDELLTAALATVVAAAGWVLTGLLRRDSGTLAGAVAAASTLMTGYAVWAWTQTFDLADQPAGLILGLSAAVILLLAPRVLAGAGRILLEAATAPVALGAVVVTGEAGDAAPLLTLLGVAITLWSVVHRDREPMAWLAAGVLAIAFGLRVADGSVPEISTVPAAAVLLGAGWLRMRGDHAVSTWRTLAAGTTLALVPSLVHALDDHVSLRMLLVAMGAAVALAIGIVRRWQAPVVVGAAVLVVIGLRFLGPLAGDLLSNVFLAWILYGLAGLTLLVFAVLWEQTLHGLRRGWGYVSALR